QAILKATHEVIAYTPGPTTVKTTADEALGAGRGGGQGFAHLLTAACPGLGLPARYVSGYVFAPRRGTAAASHAWTDVFVAGQGWISLHPTAGSAQTDHHVPVGTG